MLRPWLLFVVAVCAGCGLDDRGIHGGGADEDDAGLSVDAADDAPLARDGGALAPDLSSDGLGCQLGLHEAAGACAPNDQVSCCGDTCLACAPPANGTVACVARQCVPSCNAGFHLAGNQCSASDTPACCGSSCATCPGVSHATAVCRAGACDLVCDAGYHRDGAGCARDDNPDCCGATCTRCSALPNAAPACQAGQCGFTCNAGFHASGAGCQPNDDLACCGPACQTCNATRANATAVCGPSGCADPSPCLSTHHDCNGQCVPSDSVASCGAACTPCADRPRATVSCSGGTCAYACAANFADCDGNPNNGCEADLRSDPLNCGGCATGPKGPHVCAAGGNHQQLCVDGQCGCPTGWGDCNGDGSDGCEVNLQTSNIHCGACNPHNPSELDLLTEQAYKAANADPACRVYKLETCEMGHCKGP